MRQENVVVTPEQDLSDSAIQIEITKLLVDIDQTEIALDRDFVKLGVLLDRVRRDKLWDSLNYSGYNEFIKSLADKYQHASRTKLYACARIADTLLDCATAQDIENMGMSKASKLASAIKKADGKKPTDELLAKAKDSKVTVQEFDKQIAGEYEFKNEFESGTWLDLSGIFLNEEERDEFYRGVRVACMVDPAVQVLDKWNDNKASHIRKEIIVRWVREFLGTYEKEVNG